MRGLPADPETATEEVSPEVGEGIALSRAEDPDDIGGPMEEPSLAGTALRWALVRMVVTGWVCLCVVGSARGEPGPVIEVTPNPNPLPCASPVKDTTFIPTPNGCSTPTGNDPAALFSDYCVGAGSSFLAPCNSHDICYQTCGAVKSMCDSLFLDNMVAVCLGVNLLCLPRCMLWAGTYYTAVASVGGSSFTADQCAACTCCGDGTCGNAIGCGGPPETVANCFTDCCGSVGSSCPPSCCTGLQCCGGTCVNQDEVCCGGNACPAGSACCGGLCGCPPGQTCSGDTCVDAGGSTGDPHLVTFDGLLYDLQLPGDFVLVRAGSELEVQARQVSVPLYPGRTVNGEIAMRLGSNRVTVATALPGVQVNGVPTTLGDAPVVLEGGETLRLKDNVLAATRPGGDLVEVRLGGAYLDVRIHPSPVLLPRGLLGDHDGDTENDLAPRGGQAYSAVSTGRLYGEFAESWRVSPDESLFDHPWTGNWPSLPSDTIMQDDIDSARELCKLGRISHPALLDACILDVAITGDPSMVESVAWLPVPRAVLPGGAPAAPEDILNEEEATGGCAMCVDTGDRRGALLLLITVGVALRRRSVRGRRDPCAAPKRG